LGDHVDHLPDVVVRHDDLELHLRHEVDDVGRAAVDLLLAARAAEALHLGDRHPVHADLGEALLHLVELERLDDGLDLLHAVMDSPPFVSGGFRAWKKLGPPYSRSRARNASIRRTASSRFPGVSWYVMNVAR